MNQAVKRLWKKNQRSDDPPGGGDVRFQIFIQSPDSIKPQDYGLWLASVLPGLLPVPILGRNFIVPKHVRRRPFGHLMSVLRGRTVDFSPPPR